MPVVIHERKAHEDGLRIIDEFPDVKGRVPLLFRQL